MIRILLATILLSAASGFAGTTGLLHTFKKIRATDQFWAEGAAIGDFNHDGKMDVVSGAYWYEGPDFKKHHERRTQRRAGKSALQRCAEQPGVKAGNADDEPGVGSMRRMCAISFSRSGDVLLNGLWEVPARRLQ